MYDRKLLAKLSVDFLFNLPFLSRFILPTPCIVPVLMDNESAYVQRGLVQEKRR
jgi:hypothetical protein